MTRARTLPGSVRAGLLIASLILTTYGACGCEPHAHICVTAGSSWRRHVRTGCEPLSATRVLQYCRAGAAPRVLALPAARHVLWAEVVLGGECVVCAAAQGDVVFSAGAAAREGLVVMELEACGLSAAYAAFVAVCAASAVALPYGAAQRCG